MSYKHPDDSARMAAVLAQVRRRREPLNSRHRIVDVMGDTHEVIVVGTTSAGQARSSAPMASTST